MRVSNDRHGRTWEALVGKGDAAAQTRQTLQNIERALVRAGATLAVEVRALLDPDMLVEIEAEAYIFD